MRLDYRIRYEAATVIFSVLEGKIPEQYALMDVEIEQKMRRVQIRQIGKPEEIEEDSGATIQRLMIDGDAL